MRSARAHSELSQRAAHPDHGRDGRGRIPFLIVVGGVALVLGWIAWLVVENGGPLCGPTTEGYCHHGKVTPWT
jgi:hypothetical protein